MRVVVVEKTCTGFGEGLDTRERESPRKTVHLQFVQLDWLNYHLLSLGLLKKRTEIMNKGLETGANLMIFKE